MHRLKTFVLLLAGGLVLGGCGLVGAGKPGDAAEQLVGATWQLTALRTPDGSTTPVDALVGRADTSAAYALTFETDGALGGVADCNRYGGDYAARDNGTLSVDNLVSTEQYCGEASREGLYLEGLAAADAYEVDDGALRIYFDGEGVLRFERGADS